MKAIDRAQLQALLEEAKIKPRLRRDLRFVPEEITDWDHRDFIAIMNRSQSEGVLIAPLAIAYVVPFRLQRRKPNASGRVEAIICDFCMTWQRGTNSAVISFIRDKSSVSFLCCADLLCSLHVRSKTEASQLSKTQIRETIAPNDRIVRLRDKLIGILSGL